MAQRGMTVFPVTLAAGVSQSFNVEGDFLHILTAPDALGIRFDEGKLNTLYQGVGLRVYYNRIELLSDTSQSVVVMLGFGHVNDSRASVSATINTTIAPGNLNTQLPEVSVPAGDSAKIADANTDRKFLRLSIKSTETGGVYIGDATIADNEGGWLEAGQGDYFPSEAETWAYNPGAVDVIVTALDVERV